jgi:hypothetical protein
VRFGPQAQALLRLLSHPSRHRRHRR